MLMTPNQVNVNQVNTSERLASLDILRGLDLFLLVFLQPVIFQAAHMADVPWLHALAYQFDHEVWEGFRFWDLIMPLFLFMAGTSMPFSLSRYGADRKALYRKVVKRFLILFVLGMVIQGNLLGFDIDRLYIYVNTLQAIAAGYLFAAIILTELKLKGQIVATVVLLFLYWLPMTLAGDFSMDGNLAGRIDAYVFGKFRGDPSYSWLLSSLTFTVTTLLGVFAGRILKENKGKPNHRPLILIGLALIAVSLIWQFQMPIIKRIWTCTMTLFSGGICFVLMGVFYYWIDYKKHRRGWEWLKIYGMNSIMAYILGEFFNFRSIVHTVSYGLEPHLGRYYDAWLTLGNGIVILLVLRLMYRHKVFLKV